MSELKICRICLRTEAKVYHYEQFQLKAYYEEVLAMKVTEKDDLPHYFCFECATLLHKFHKFKEKCYSGQKVLKEMLLKGPAGILEQLKLKNMEMSSPLCANSSSQDIEVHPFVDTDIDINNLPIVTDGITSNDPVEIDSSYIHSLNVVFPDERMIKNLNSSNQTLDKVQTFENETIKIDQSNTVNIDGEFFIENEQSSIVICELPSINDQVFDETNLQYIASNSTLESQNDVDSNMGYDTDNESSPITHLPSTSKDLFKTCVENEEPNKKKNFKRLESSNTIEDPTSNIDKKNTKLYLQNENHHRKVRLVSKNQLAPNIHGVTLSKTSEQYFDALEDTENADSDDSLNQLNVDHDCIPIDSMTTQTRKKRVRKKHTVKRVKPSPCNKKCGNNCTVRVTELDRQVIHERYWNMDKQEQQEWLLSCIKPKQIRRRQGSTLMKSITYDYFILVGDKNIKVCQQFLMKTLDVSQMKFRYAIFKLGCIPDSKSEDKCSDSDTDTS